MDDNRDNPAGIVHTERTSEIQTHGRLSVMPLAALLPKVGELSSLSKLSAGFERRLEELQARKNQIAADEGEERVRRLSEESMLNQLMQWLSAG